MKKPVPIPPPGKLQIKKAAIISACNLLPELDKRVNAYDRSSPFKRLPNPPMPRPALRAIYMALDAYPFALYTNMLARTRPMIRRSDSLVADCLGLVDTGNMEGVFTPGDYDQLTQWLTLARCIVEDVYKIETLRPNPGKVGTRPNAGNASPETRVQAIQRRNGYQTPTLVYDARPLLARQSSITAALDELAVVERTRTIEDVPALLYALKLYGPNSPTYSTDRDESFLIAADVHVNVATQYCRRMMRDQAVTLDYCHQLGNNLERALSIIDHYLP